MRTIVFSLIILFMVGCGATHHNKITASHLNPINQPINVKDCKDCEVVKQLIKAHFLKKRWEYLSNKDKKTGLRTVEGMDSVYYSDINFDSLIRIKIIQKCFTEKCFTKLDAKYMFGNDNDYKGTNYKYGIRLRFTTNTTCPICNFVADADVSITSDSLGFLTSIGVFKIDSND